MKEITLLLKSKKTREEQLEYVSNIAVATGVPVVVVAQYMGELYGFDDALTKMIARLRHFYKITELRGCKDI